MKPKTTITKAAVAETLPVPDKGTEERIATWALDSVKARPIASDDDFRWYSDILTAVKTKAKQWDEARKSITAPLQNALRNVNAHFAPATKIYTELEAMLKTAMTSYRAERRAEQEAAMMALQPVPQAPQLAQGMCEVVTRKWRVTDDERVPRAFCSPDARKIQEHLDNGGLEAIPGIEFYNDVSLRVRT